MATVAVVQRVLPHYRVAFFQRLASRLDACGHRLRVIYGQEAPGTTPISVQVPEPWALSIRNTYLQLLSGELVWQPCIRPTRDADLIIAEQASRLLVNYLLLLGPGRRGRRIAYWGHGRNMQAATPGTLRERFKKLLVGHVDWWFAYTRVSAEVVQASGFPHERITVVENAIDTQELDTAMRALNPADIERLRSELRITGHNVCLYCGGMYADKKLDLLLAACNRVRERIADFEMIFVGSGPQAALVEEAARTRPWLHYVGARYGRERVPYFALSRLQLLPGSIGLAILDSFIARVPMVTTSAPVHGPEIAYLDAGINGVMTPPDVDAYADAICALLHDPERLDRLRDGCARSAERYTLNNMVNNFATGIERCLAAPAA